MINAHLSISQTTYPKEIVLNGDSLIAITYNQQRIINADLEELQGCRVVLDSTEALVLHYDTLVKDGVSLINNLKSQIELKDDQLKWKEESISLYDKEYRKQLKANKTNKTIFGVIITTIAVGFGTGLIYMTTH